MAVSFFGTSKTEGINVLDVVVPTEVTGITSTAHALEGADFKNECSPNSIIKYINLTIQAAIKTDNAEFRPGWIEYALIHFENENVTPPIPSAISTGLGTETLPNLVKTWYRGHAVWTGSVPISAENPVALPLSIKIPNKWCKNARGTFWKLWVIYRSSKGTDTVTEIKSINSAQYKCYL